MAMIERAISNHISNNCSVSKERMTKIFDGQNGWADKVIAI